MWNHERIFIATCLVRRVVSNINEGETNGLAAAVMNVFCFLPTLYYFFYTAMLADGLAPALIFPVLLASMYSDGRILSCAGNDWLRDSRDGGVVGRRRDSRGGVLVLAGTRRTRKVAENKKVCDFLA
jgi:hypothetical protein